jgi:hypothetical protein
MNPKSLKSQSDSERSVDLSDLSQPFAATHSSPLSEATPADALDREIEL